MTASPSHCVHVAASERSAAETARPDGADPTRTSGRRSGALMRLPPHARRSSRPASAVDAERRPRPRLEPRLGDRPAAVRADAVRAVLDSLQRGLDVEEDLLGVLLERVI